MATVNMSVTPDTLITIKVQQGPEQTKLKLPLRDLRPEVLPAKLRRALGLPSDLEYTFERYSDSAGAFIKLDSDNPSVYKQLNRAAKAKLKLRIRVTPADLMSSAPVNNLPSFPALMDPTALDLAALHISPQEHYAPQVFCSASVTGQAVDAPGTSRVAQPVQTQSEEFRRYQDNINKQFSNQLVGVNAYLEEVKQNMAEDFVATFGRNLSSPQLKPRTPACSGPPEPDMPRYPSPPFSLFSVCCNHCKFAIPDHHWHCNICSEGDFDLCQKCLDAGEHCSEPDHYLVRRTLEDGKIVASTTDTVSKTTIGSAGTDDAATAAPASAVREVAAEVPGAYNELAEEQYSRSRTCNSCINIFDDSQFVTCRDCDDFDLCIACHLVGNHGHHPGHAFAPAIDDMILEDQVAAACEPGRNQVHAALCDGCDKTIVGVRHKCLECPDFDYCNTCHKSSHFIHPGHRFAPIYAPLETGSAAGGALHVGVRCDGPLCSSKRWIVGVRYKCAICNDFDLCGNCEALPDLDHNRSHPMIKFRTPMGDATVTTYHDSHDGLPTQVLGDRQPQTSSRGTETTPVAPSANAATQVQAEAEVETEAEKKKIEPETEVAQTVAEPESKPEPKKKTSVAGEEDAAEVPKLNAYYISDWISDGTEVTPGQQIYQSWTMYNPSEVAWPKGCALRWAGGDHMIDIDMTAPGSVSDFMAASKSNSTHEKVAMGGEYSFSIKLRAPPKTGRAVSYWRLYSPEGKPFGHRLWCHVEVLPVPASTPAPASSEEPEAKLEKEAELSESQMVFPKLEKESPASSTHLSAVTAPLAASPIIAEEAEELLSHDDVESVTVDLDDDDDDTTDDGFLTDEDYDMLEDARQ